MGCQLGMHFMLEVASTKEEWVGRELDKLLSQRLIYLKNLLI